MVLGGVNIPHLEGLQGHSDADVLVHAVIDALLGAAALGDIGTHFPPGDARYRGISSILLLGRAYDLLQEAGFEVNNVDSVIVAQEPHLLPYLQDMRDNMASSLQIEAGSISVKATTTENLGFAGRKEGMAAYAVVTIIDRGWKGEGK